MIGILRSDFLRPSVACDCEQKLQLVKVTYFQLRRCIIASTTINIIMLDRNALLNSNYLIIQLISFRSIEVSKAAIFGSNPENHNFINRKSLFKNH